MADPTEDPEPRPKVAALYSVEPDGTKVDAWIHAELLGDDDYDWSKYVHVITADDDDEEPPPPTTLAVSGRDLLLLGDFPGHPFRGNQFTEGTTHVGITSARPGRSSKLVEREMHEFHSQLKNVPGIKDVSVTFGRGIFFGVAEPTWVVSYKGNGEARRLLAKTAQKHDQDAVLIMKPGKTDVAVDVTFDRSVGSRRRDHIQRELTKQGLAGGTWFDDGHKTTLRMASVKHWGGNKAEHLVSTAALRDRLSKIGIKGTVVQHDIDTEVIERDNYSSIINNSAVGETMATEQDDYDLSTMSDDELRAYFAAEDAGEIPVDDIRTTLPRLPAIPTAEDEVVATFVPKPTEDE